MLRWTHIGAGIHPVEKLYQFCQTIVPGKHLGTQILTGGIQQKCSCGNTHGHHQIPAVLPKGRISPQVQPQVDTHDAEIPEKIRDQKAFHKRDPVIQNAVHRVVIGCRVAGFDQQIAQAKDGPKQQICTIIILFKRTGNPHRHSIPPVPIPFFDSIFRKSKLKRNRLFSNASNLSHQ